jgi:hypothetical protein
MQPYAELKLEAVKNVLMQTKIDGSCMTLGCMRLWLRRVRDHERGDMYDVGPRGRSTHSDVDQRTGESFITKLWQKLKYHFSS